MRHFYAPDSRQQDGLRYRLFHVVFGYEQRAAIIFDAVLVVLILLSVAVLIGHSLSQVPQTTHQLFSALEWIFTGLFTLEYLIRLWVVRDPLRYARSFYGVIDLLAIVPTYLALLFPESGVQYLAVIRILRILRIFDVLHMRRYQRETSVLLDAFDNSWRKILVFLVGVITIITIFGALLFVVEGPKNGFSSIPIAMYWALISVSTVGYGDITPITALGKFIASILVLIGYGIIAVPTGIYSAQVFNSIRQQSEQTQSKQSSQTPSLEGDKDDNLIKDGRACQECGLSGHDSDAKFCRQCGFELNSPQPENTHNNK